MFLRVTGHFAADNYTYKLTKLCNTKQIMYFFVTYGPISSCRENSAKKISFTKIKTVENMQNYRYTTNNEEKGWRIKDNATKRISFEFKMFLIFGTAYTQLLMPMFSFRLKFIVSDPNFFVLFSVHSLWLYRLHKLTVVVNNLSTYSLYIHRNHFRSSFCAHHITHVFLFFLFVFRCLSIYLFIFHSTFAFLSTQFLVFSFSTLSA